MDVKQVVYLSYLFKWLINFLEKQTWIRRKMQLQMQIPIIILQML